LTPEDIDEHVDEPQDAYEHVMEYCFLWLTRQSILLLAWVRQKQIDKVGRYFMQAIIDSASKRGAAKKLSVDLNFNKLLAVLCVAASAATSIAVIAWSAQTFFRENQGARIALDTWYSQISVCFRVKTPL
jgi:hypothetical protein